MQCVTQCETTTQIAINDTQFDSRPICRDFEYYVNPDSDSIVELGTIDHPYKKISYAFVEILNYHSHTDRNLTIYLMEYTRNELPVGTGNIVNITNVDIRPYTLRSDDPDKATIVGIDETEIVADPSTSFSIIKSYELRVNDMITNYDSITDEEVLKVSIEDSLILLFKSSIALQNLELTTEYNNLYSNFMFVYPVLLQQKKATFKDLHISISGTIMRVYDPMYLWIENISVDYYRNLGGFHMAMTCNYPEANLDASMYALNTSFYYSQPRAVNPVEGTQLISELPGDMVVVDYKGDTYFYFHEKYGIIMNRVVETCSPDIDSGRYFNVTNVNLTIPEPLSVGNLIFMGIFSDILRPTHTYFENID